jgi:hypothetical protein
VAAQEAEGAQHVMTIMLLGWSQSNQIMRSAHRMFGETIPTGIAASVDKIAALNPQHFVDDTSSATAH